MYVNRFNSQNNSIINYKVVLILIAILLYSLYAINYTLGLNNIATGLMIVALFMLPANEDILVYAALIPFHPFIADDSFFRLFMLIGLSIIKILMYNRKLNRKNLLLFLTWFSIEIIIDAIYSGTFDYSIVTLMIYVALYMSQTWELDKNLNKKLMMILLMAFTSATVFSIIGSPYEFTYYLQSTSSEVRFGEDTKQLGGAMNIPIYSALSIAIAIIYIVKKKKKNLLVTALTSIICLFSFIIGGLTVSRSFIVAIIFGVVWGAISFAKDKKRFDLKIVIGVIVTLGVSFFFIYRFNVEINNIIIKFGQRSFLASSRSEIYRDCFDYLFTHPLNLLFGSGMLGYHSIGIRDGYAFAKFAHNIVLDAVMSWGIVGSAAFFALIVSFNRKLKQVYGKCEMFYFLPFIVWISFMMLGGTFNYVEPYLYLIILMVYSYSTCEDYNNAESI